MNNEEFLNSLKLLGIEVTKKELSKFEKYKDLLKEYNQKFNLTSITNDLDIYLKHFYDSLCLFKIKEVKENKTLLDIGTGAGFPGIPIAIMHPTAKITLLDSINSNLKVYLLESNTKKCEFLKIVKQELNLNNIEVINSRAEDFIKTHKEEFDLATSRAVSHLKILSELEIPALKINGLFIPLKSHYEEELKETEPFLKTLNSELTEIITYTLPIENSKRTILKITKQKTTPSIYPRNYSQIKKSLNKKQ